MSHRDTYLCQVCARVIDGDADHGAWRTDITGHESAGMVCTPCIKKHDDCPIGIVEHCRRESGLTGAALQRYINRHYGHG